MNPQKLKLVRTPANWTAEKDCNYFESHWDPSPTYTAALWREMRSAHCLFVAALDDSLRYLSGRDARIILIEPPCRSSAEKLEELFEIAHQSALVRSYRELLLEALCICQHTESERQRVLKAYRLAGEHAWMCPVVFIIEALVGASLVLDEVMESENDDYTKLIEPPPQW